MNLHHKLIILHLVISIQEIHLYLHLFNLYIFNYLNSLHKNSQIYHYHLLLVKYNNILYRLFHLLHQIKQEGIIYFQMYFLFMLGKYTRFEIFNNIINSCINNYIQNQPLNSNTTFFPPNENTPTISVYNINYKQSNSNESIKDIPQLDDVRKV